MDTKLVECFGIDPRSRGLRVQISNRKSFVFAHEHFIHSDWEAGDEVETLKIYFMNHEVTITGYDLRRIEAMMQSREIAWVIPAQRRYRAGDKGFIMNMSVRCLDDENAPTEPNPAD